MRQKVKEFKKPKLYLLTGYPGAGKTYYREHNDKLKDLKCVDVADIYQRRPGITPHEVRMQFIMDLFDVADTEKEFVGEIVGTGKQLETIQYYCQDVIDIEIIHVSTPKALCIKRVEMALKKEPDSPYHRARMYILEGMP